MKNKKIWKWLAINLLLFVGGASIISNAVFIPKYYNLKNNSENQFDIKIEIKIWTYKDSVTSIDESQELLFDNFYITKIINLGQLMSQYKDTYVLSNYAGFGNFIEGIKYKNKLIKNNENNFWSLFYNEKESNVGIDGINLKTNDVIDLFYDKIKL